jgi:pimeloyl-ACP methyl ester carboxylesterase
MANDLLLFAQHGWADNNQAMLALASQLAAEQTQAQVHIVAPCLNYAMTWLRIAPLIDEVEALAIANLARYPGLPVRIVGHSMGGLIWAAF